tara:strand:- start:974 stop:1627 length:654 start_codon:yes stop_codon:yes gene_type:complete
MRVAILSSGGKDSSAAIWWAKCKGWEVTHLVTVTISGEDSMTFQIPGTHLVEYQSVLCNCSWLQVISSGIEDIEMLELQNALSSLEIDGLVSGALRSDYQKNRIERMCENLRIHSFTPIWHQNVRNHMFELIDNGFEIMITSVSCDGLSDGWLGKILDYESLLELESLSQKYRFNFDGEGGEYETLVISGPHMNGRLRIESQKVWDGKRGHLEITPI